LPQCCATPIASAISSLVLVSSAPSAVAAFAMALKAWLTSGWSRRNPLRFSAMRWVISG